MFEELKKFEIDPAAVCVVLGKLYVIRAALQRIPWKGKVRQKWPERPLDKDRLTFQDLDLIASIEKAMSRGSARLMLYACMEYKSMPNLEAMASNILEVFYVFQYIICPLLFKSFKTGDIIFYDLANRKRMGLEASSSMMLIVQKAYDRFSHSGIFVAGQKNEEPVLLHGLRLKLKRLMWVDTTYMPKRRIDFSRVFERFDELASVDKERIRNAYIDTVHKRKDEQDDYTFNPPTMFDGLSFFFTSREYTACPAMVQKKSLNLTDRTLRSSARSSIKGAEAAGAVPTAAAVIAAAVVAGVAIVSNGDAPAQKSVPEPVTENGELTIQPKPTDPDESKPTVFDLPDGTVSSGSTSSTLVEESIGATSPATSNPASPRKEPTPSLGAEATNATSGEELETANSAWQMVEADKLPVTPKDMRATAMLCSGFTAGIIMECMKDIQTSFPDLKEYLQFKKGFSLDVNCMTPGDLHSWPIWKIWHSHRARAESPVFYVMADEIFEHWWTSDATLC